MVSPEHKGAAKKDSCLRKKLPHLHVLFPWKPRRVNSPKWSPLRDGSRIALVKEESVDRIPRSIIMGGAKLKFIDKTQHAIDPDQSIQIADPKTFSPAELHRLYAGTSVPEHRYLSPSLTEAVNSPEIAPHPARWIAGISGIDLPKVVDAWLNTNRSTEYEQLKCIGLDPDTGQLTGVVKVKKGSGYSGRPSTTGSREYIAFWVDWGLGFQYEGTASVAVYDFGWLPHAGLEFNVTLPDDLLSRMQTRGEGTGTVKVRAVLSWNTPPSTTDPNAPIVWGNSIEMRIPIPPGQAAREDNRRSYNASLDATVIDQASTAARIADAANQSLTGKACDSHADLMVVPESATISAGITDRNSPVNANDIEDGGTTFTMVVSNPDNMNRDAISDLTRTSAGVWHQKKS